MDKSNTVLAICLSLFSLFGCLLFDTFHAAVLVLTSLQKTCWISLGKYPGKIMFFLKTQRNSLIGDSFQGPIRFLGSVHVFLFTDLTLLFSSWWGALVAGRRWGTSTATVSTWVIQYSGSACSVRTDVVLIENNTSNLSWPSEDYSRPSPLWEWSFSSVTPTVFLSWAHCS